MACALIAALVSVPAQAAPLEPAAAGERRASIDAIVEPLLVRIEAEEARNGPFSRDLIALLAPLGLAYQEYGEHDLARAVLDRALYLQRFNDGLFNLEQAPLLERLMDSEIAMGRTDSAAEIEERLLELARRNFDDVRRVPILRDAAERDVAYYERYLRGDLPPILEINTGGTSRSRMARASVWRARGHYNQAISTLVRDGGGHEHQAELAQLEEDLTRTYYLEATDRTRWYLGPGDPLYGLGLVSYLRRVEYATAASPTPLDYARALIELADWSLIFSRNGTAVKRYEEAYGVLLEYGVPAASIEELFPAATPVFLPAFAPSPLGGAVDGATGHVDLDFEIGKYGDTRRVRVVAVDGAAAAEIARGIALAVGSARVRPSPRVEQTQTYRLRFSLADGHLAPRL